MSPKTPSEIAVTNRRDASDRRLKSERRQNTDRPPEFERRGSERRKVERRRQIDPTTCERDYTDDEIEFMKAIDKYRRESGRPFPTWSEVLEVVQSLGYQKIRPPVDSPPVITAV